MDKQPTADEVISVLRDNGDLSPANAAWLRDLKKEIVGQEADAQDLHEYLVMLKCIGSLIGEIGAPVEFRVNEAMRALLMIERDRRPRKQIKLLKKGK